jgi:hypothetical protein
MNSYVPLDPQARPVDQFIRPDVVQPAETNSAIQLASALRDFNPRLQSVLDRQFAAYKRASELRATKDVLAKRLDNMAALKRAVDNNEIPWADNPWSMAQAEQEVSKAEVRKLALGFDKALEDNPEIRFGNNPDAVASLFDQHFADFAQNLSPFAAEAAVPELDAMKSRILSQWSNQRSRERAAEREESFQDAMSSLFAEGSKFDSEDASIAQAQSLLDGALRTVDPVTANKWMLSALKDAAIQKGDAGLPTRVLSKLKGNGGASLANTAAARELQRDVSLHVSSEHIRKIHEASAIRKEQSESWSRGLTDAMLADRASNPALRLSDWKPPKEIWDAAPPGAQEEFIRKQMGLDEILSSAENRQEADAGRALLNQALSAVRAGEAPNRVFARLLPEAIALKVDSPLRTLYGDLKDELAQSPDDISRRSVLNSMDMQNELTPALVSALATQGTIPAWEVDHWLAKAATLKSDPTVGEALRVAEKRVRSFWVNRKEDKIIASITGDLTTAKAEDAIFRVNDEFLKWKLSKDNIVKGADAYQKLDEIVNRVLSSAPEEAAASTSFQSDRKTK